MNSRSPPSPYPWETAVFLQEIARNDAMDSLRESDSDSQLVLEDVVTKTPGSIHAGEADQAAKHESGLPSVAREAESDPDSLIYGEKPDFVNETTAQSDGGGLSDTNGQGQEDAPGPVEQQEAGKSQRGLAHLWRRPFIRGTGALLILLSIIFLGYTLFRAPTSDEQLVRQQPAPALDDTPGGEVQQTSPQYQETLSIYNDREADRAELEERSFVATTESVPTSLDQPDVTQPSLLGENDTQPYAENEEQGQNLLSEAPAGTITFAPESPVPAGDVILQPLDGVTSSTPESLPPSTYADSLFYNERPSPTQPGPSVPGSNSVLDTLRELTKIPVPTMRSGRFGQQNDEGSLHSRLPSGREVTDPDFPGVLSSGNGILPPQSFLTPGIPDPFSGNGHFANTSSTADVISTPPPPVYPQGIGSADPYPPFDQVGETYLLAAGTVIHAEMVNGLNSDQPGVAVAEIIEHPLQGARVLGQFTPNLASGGLSLEFQTLVLPDGSSQPVAAYGLSPWTGENLTRSILRPRVLQRYGPTALLAFVSGASALMLEDGQRIVVANDAVYQERDSQLEDRQIIAAGVSALATQVATDVQARAPTGPQILLYPGSTVALLFATSVIDPTQRSLP